MTTERAVKLAGSRKNRRQARILAALEDNAALRVKQLAAALAVSTETVRRDLTELAQAGRLSRTYGGAVTAPNRFEPQLSDRVHLNVTERRHIARAAVELVRHEDVLMLGGGATLLHFSRALRTTARRITVITPAYPIALELSANPSIEVVMLPGTYDAQEGVVCGPHTIRAIERFRPPLVLISASGLSEDGSSEAHLSVGAVYTAMVESGERSVILADHGKFDKRALMLVTGWQPTITLITDREPGTALQEAMRRAGATLRVANAED